MSWWGSGGSESLVCGRFLWKNPDMLSYYHGWENPQISTGPSIVLQGRNSYFHDIQRSCFVSDFLVFSLKSLPRLAAFSLHLLIQRQQASYLPQWNTGTLSLENQCIRSRCYIMKKIYQFDIWFKCQISQPPSCIDQPNFCQYWYECWINW